MRVCSIIGTPAAQVARWRKTYRAARVSVIRRLG
jgi:hypothetical protein